MRRRHVFRWPYRIPVCASNAAGFTLFETLAATMILATALIILLRLFSGGLGAVFLADRYTRAVFHAREKMEEILLATRMEDTMIEGRWEDGFSWKAEIARLEPEEVEILPDEPEPFHVKLEVSWTDGERQRRIDLQTLALAARLADEK
ncbi:MAG: type IV pilus modification PilV family protein [Thermodesulfobacteriota bacterium]